MVQQGGNRYPVGGDETRGSVVKIGLKAAAAGLVLAMAGGVASAALVVNEVGIANSFGVVVESDGSFDSFGIELGTPPGDGTDEWLTGTTVHHAYSFSGNITSATLTLRTGGWGFLDPANASNPATVLLQSGSDEIPIGTLGIGEPPSGNIAVVDTFTLSSDALALLASGDVYLRIVTVKGVHFDGLNSESDFGALDYSRLTITTDAGGTTPIPEPTSWALVGLALAGLAASRRRLAR